MKFLYYAIGTVFGAGLIPKAPGTMGALVAAILFFLFPVSTPALISIIVIVTVIGTWASYMIEKTSGKDDPGFIVVDEFVGQAIALIAIPHHWAFYLAAFILFRVFDIWKPLGINQIQHVKYGIGVMLDD
ncbi:MAG: phosphatidylglycerophosphatase A, partial [Calditrichia bacterium]|nr:phosphatidylglycerophosphatase A [Calditrichia bacterium]